MGCGWKITCLVALFLVVHPVLKAEETMTAPALSIDNQIHDIWAKAKKPMKAGFHYGIARGDVYVLYNIEISTINLLTYAGRRHDTEILDDLAQLYLAAFPYLKTDKSGNQVWIYTAATTSVAKENPRLIGTEVMLCSVQFLYAVSFLIEQVVHIEPAKRTPAMNAAVEKFGPVIIRDHYLRWIAKSEPKMIKKLETGLANKKFANHVGDNETFLLAGVVKILAANSADAKAIPLSAAEKRTFIDFAVTGSKLMQSRLSKSNLKDFSGKPVTGLNFDQGMWDQYQDCAYAGYTGEKYPEPSDKRTVTGVGWDISHARRFVDIFNTLHENRAITRQSFPDETVMKDLANQVAYKVFNKDFKHPLFTNYMDGTNGWYRVGYAGRKKFGYAPYKLSSAIPNGGYGFWSRFNPDIQKILLAFLEWSQNAKATNDPDFLKYYSKEYFNNNGASIQLLEFLPTIADYKKP